MNTDMETIIRQMDKNDKKALAALPQPDWGYLPDELWWLFYGLIGKGLMTGGTDRMMRRTELGDAVLQQIRQNDAG